MLAPSREQDRPSVWGELEPAIAGTTHVGVTRRVNQDAFGRHDDPRRGEILLVVADGLGGHRGGEVASQMATELIGPLCAVGDDDAPVRLTRAIADANRRIYDTASREDGLEGMGTTVVCLLLARGGSGWVAHVGDSRLYRVERDGLEALTEDHSLVATLVREGVLTPEEARRDPRRNQILRALGVRKEIEIDVAPLALRPGETLLLCTDGLHGLVDEREIAVLAHAEADPALATERLVEAANRAGGTDNVTCMLVRIPTAPSGSASRSPHTPAPARGGRRLFERASANPLARFATAFFDRFFPRGPR